MLWWGRRRGRESQRQFRVADVVASGQEVFLWQGLAWADLSFFLCLTVSCEGNEGLCQPGTLGRPVGP